MKRILFLILTFVLATDAFSQTEPTKPISVGILSVAGPRRTLANDITALLAVKLSADPRFTVVDRSDLSKTLDEQALGRAGFITPETAAKIGRLTGDKILVAGREFNETDSKIVIVASVIDTENGKVVSKTAQGTRENLVDLVADLSQQLAPAIAGQFTNSASVNTIPRQDRIAHVIKNITGTRRPAVSIKINEQLTAEPIAHRIAETELGLIFQKAGFVVVNEKSDQKPGVVITGNAILADSQKNGKLFSGHVVLEIKASQPETGKIVSLDRQDGVAIDVSKNIAATQALQNAADDLAERLVPLLAQ